MVHLTWDHTYCTSIQQNLQVNCKALKKGKCLSREETQLFSSMEEANLQLVASSHHQILKKDKQQTL